MRQLEKDGAQTGSEIQTFPDGTLVSSWFSDDHIPALDEVAAPGAQYVATDYGVLSDGAIHTQELQALINRVSSGGGGVIVFPAGTFLTGAVWLKAGVHLYLEKDALLKGSDDIADYPSCKTRIEGEWCTYFPALINADGVDGLTIFGDGTIDGNGERSWRAFWLRRVWNPECTNKDEQRARLIYIANSRNVTIAGVHLQNAQFWTLHLYKCSQVKVLGCSMYSPREPVPAPSTDAIDLDVCSDVLIKHCTMEVNDDAVALKGGKGAYADTAAENGSNERIIIEDCTYGFCHGCLTLGSESVHNRNIIVRRVQVSSGYNLLWLKMRPDTPQCYEYVTVEDITGAVDNMVTVRPWTQFYNAQGRTDIPVSRAHHITMRRINCACKTAYNIEQNDSQYLLSDFFFAQIADRAPVPAFLRPQLPKVVDLFLFAGQSNMAGRGNALRAAVCPAGSGYEFHSVAALQAQSAGGYEYAQEPLVTRLSEPFGKRENNAVLNDINAQGLERRRGSMVSAFASAYFEKNGVPVLGVSACRGGAPVSFFTGDAVLAELTARFTEALRYAAAQGMTVRRKACLWCQGETDGDRATPEPVFKANMERLFASLTEAGVTDLFIIKTGHFNYAFKPGADGKPTAEDFARDARYAQINRWQEEFAAAHERVHIAGDLYTDHYFSLLKDPFHYEQEAYNEIGASAARQVTRSFSVPEE